MVPFDTFSLLLNGLTLALALGFVIIILWYDPKSRANQFFAIFLFFIILWNIGSILIEAEAILGEGALLSSFNLAARSIAEFGFIGSSAVIYIFLTVMIGIHAWYFRIVTVASLVLVVGYRIFLIVTETDVVFEIIPLFYFVIFDLLTLFLVWRFRRKLRSRGIATAVLIITVGKLFTFANPELAIASFAVNLSSFGSLILSFSIVQRKIITPLSESLSQVEAIHRVSLAVTSQLSLDTVLDEIASQACGWLNADGTGIFLTFRENHRDSLRMETVYHLPGQYLHHIVPFGVDIMGKVASERETVFLENYSRDWKGEVALPLARSTFGSLICTPLIYADKTIGVLLVVAGLQGRLFDKRDARLLELLAAQAAVAIGHSRAFEEQRNLAAQLEEAHGQLKTVLTSTENPVIAVDRQLDLMFANPAARSLFDANDQLSIMENIPHHLFPESPKDVLREIKSGKSYIYEVSLKGQVFFCHLASLGVERVEGWVAVLNDVTELKELDRLKSEMVRMASHDLKNPLMGAMAYLDLLGEDLADNAEAEKSIRMIERQMERMQRIISGILDLERIKLSRFVPELCQAQDVIEDAVHDLSDFIYDSDIDVDVIIDEGKLSFWGDREQFSRALVNLIENAIKFTPSGNGHVYVRAYCKDDQIIFEVEDQGIGIPDTLRDRIFDRFFRGEQKGIEHVTGTGLGLSLVKNIVENHEGSIWFKSYQDTGTVFYITVPHVNSINNFA
jgi:signal transduction histidine kinase